MVTIQQLFDKRYSEKKEEEIQFSDLNERKVSAGELTIKNFPNLKKVNINNVKSLTKLKIINCPQLTRLNCQNNDLLTSLDLSECDKLMKIQVSNNRLELIKFPTFASFSSRKSKFSQKIFVNYAYIIIFLVSRRQFVGKCVQQFSNVFVV